MEDDDFETPNVTIQEPDLTGFNKVMFANVISRHEDAVDTNGDGTISDDERDNEDNAVGLFDTENDTALYIEGYVVSSDRSGNFFEELVVQNSTDGNNVGDDARTGFNVQINVRSLSDTYEFGRKVYIKLNGLAIGIENGVYTIGRSNGRSLEQLQEFEYLDFVVRSSEVATITPKVVAINDLTEADENTLVQFDDMQFNRREVRLNLCW